MTATHSFRTDETWRRFGSTIVAGSPLRIFAIRTAALPLLAALEHGEPIDPTDAGGRALLDRLLDAGAIHPVISAAPQHAERRVTVVTPQLGGEVRDDGRITVDDGSDPPLPGATVRLDRNRGPAAARNRGRLFAAGEVLVFIDADVVAAAGWYLPLLAHFDDPRVGVVAPRVAGDVALDLGGAPARIRAGSRVSYVPAAALVVRTQAFDAIGGFDETLRVGEDVDFVWRLDEAGWRCRYDPAVVVQHRPRPDLASRLGQVRSYGASAAPLALRHPRSLAPARFNGWTATAWILLAGGQPVAALILAAGSTAALVPALPALPASESIALAARGHLAAGRQLLEAARRVWWPALLVASLVSRRARRIAVLAVVSGGAPRRLLDDLAYGWGVWSGVVRHRTIAPLLPRVDRFPPRTRR